MINKEQQSQTISSMDKYPFQGIELHHIGYFPIRFISRYENHATTLSLFEIAPKFRDSNIEILNRPSHIFRNSPQAFEQLKLKASEDKSFTHVEIIKSPSDLGLSCYLHAKHISGEEIFFDGIIFRVTLKITDDKFYLKDATSLMSYPSHPKSIESLNYVIREIKPDFPVSVYNFQGFYTALNTQWDLLEINVSGNPSMQLSLNDPDIVTITSLVYQKYGRDYNFYIGDYRRILQLITHDFYQSIEIDNWRKYIELKTKKATESFQQALDSFSALSEDFWKLRLKIKSWSKAKKGFTYLIQELPILYQYRLLTETYEKVAMNKLSSINGVRQILVFEDENYNRSAIAHWEKYFFSGEVEDNRIRNISTEPISPIYTEDIELLKSAVTVLENTVQESFALNKDLFAAAQTEFSAYSIWLAITSVIISVILGALPIFSSFIIDSSKKPESQIKSNVRPLQTIIPKS